MSEIDIPTIIYDKGAVKLDVEVSDPFLWERLEKHLTAEFPELSQNLGDWKKSIATIVEKCHGITKTIVDRLAQMVGIPLSLILTRLVKTMDLASSIIYLLT